MADIFSLGVGLCERWHENESPCPALMETFTLSLHISSWRNAVSASGLTPAFIDSVGMLRGRKHGSVWILNAKIKKKVKKCVGDNN